MVTSRFFPDYGGGVKQALSLCQKLTDRGVKPLVVTFNHNKRLNNGMVMREMVDGIRVIRLSPLMKGERFTKYPNLLNFLLNHKTAYQILHVHGIDYQAYTAALAAQLVKKKVIAKIAGYGGDDPLTILNTRLGTFKLRMISVIDTIVCTTNQLFRSCLDAGLAREKLVRIPNGVDIDKFSPLPLDQKINLRQRLGIGKQEMMILFTGALRPLKGIELLLASVSRLANMNPPLKLVLVGPCDKEKHWGIDEHYVTTLRNKAAEMKHQVTFAGYVHNIEKYLQAADLFVLPSWREGLSNSLLEAMACGLPCVATQIPCNQEIIRNGGNGFLFQPGNIDDLTAKLLQLIEHSSLRNKIGIQARRTILETFSIDKVADTYLHLYRNMLSHS